MSQRNFVVVLGFNNNLASLFKVWLFLSGLWGGSCHLNQAFRNLPSELRDAYRAEKGQHSDALFARLWETAGFINSKIKAQKGYNITLSKTVPLYCIFLMQGWVSVEWCYTGFSFCQHTGWLNTHYCLHGYNTCFSSVQAHCWESIGTQLFSYLPLIFFKTLFHWYNTLFLANPFFYFLEKVSTVTEMSPLLPQGFYRLTISDSRSLPANLRCSSVIHSHSTYYWTSFEQH